MEKEDIVNGLKQAISRGSTLERATQSFINAGYSERDVVDSANVLQNSVSSLSMTTNLPNIQTPYPKSTQRLPNIPKYNPVQQPVQPQIPIRPNPSLPPIPQPVQKPISQQNMQQPEAKKQASNKSVIILIGVLVILLGILGASLFFMNRGA